MQNKKESVLLTGGAGYIGSHTALAMIENGADVYILDNLSTGSRDNVPKEASFYEGDIFDEALVKDILNDNQIGTVVHFAGSIIVPESVTDPLKYYDNNTSASCKLARTCIRNNVRRFIFSSTAAVYGAPNETAVTEETPTEPISPYGTSKLMTEWMLRDASRAYDFKYIALRYFNVAGADPKGRIGQTTPNATHLIKVAAQVTCGTREYMEIFGNDYDTPDGTCIRDFIHVSDLASAHVSAMEYLIEGGGSMILNCGYGKGTSVKEVLEAFETVSGQNLDIRMADRRSGDIACLIANSDKLKNVLNWQPQHDDLETIVRTTLDWEMRMTTETSSHDLGSDQ